MQVDFEQLVYYADNCRLKWLQKELIGLAAALETLRVADRPLSAEVCTYMGETCQTKRLAHIRTMICRWVASTTLRVPSGTE